MYEDKIPENIKSDILSAIEKLDTREGSFADDMVGPLALELYKMYTSLSAVKPMVWVDETSGAYLDLAAEELGIEPRKPGVKARVLLLITGSPGCRIADKTAFLTAENLYFYTKTELVIPESGSAEIFAVAAQSGALYNVDAETVTLQYQNNAGIKSVTNPLLGEGGTDMETDKNLYQRIVAARQRPSTSGNVYDYEKWALETPGVGAVKIYPLWNGNGTVKVLVVNSQRQPVDDTIVSACAAHIEQVRPVGAAVTVQSARSIPINISVSVATDPGYGKELIQEQFLAAFTDYLYMIAFHQYEISYNRIGAILIGIPGVRDYSDLKINHIEGNISFANDQIPCVGEVVLI